MAEEALRTDEVRQMANSYDGVPNDVFDRWLAEHDREVHAAGVAEGIRQARAQVESYKSVAPAPGQAWYSEALRAIDAVGVGR